MENKRKFQKFFTRSMSLLTAEYWYLGESAGLEKLTEGAMHFEPLFIYDGHGGVSIYYEMNNPKLYLAPLIDYFRQKPETFPPLVKLYQDNISAIETLTKEPNVENFEKIYQHIVSAWPMISVSVIVGRLVDDPQLKDIAKQAFDLRHSTDKIEYQAANILSDLAKFKLPDFKTEVDFLTYEEIVKPQQIVTAEIKARKKGYMFFNGQVQSGLTLDDFLKNNNIEFQDEAAALEIVTELKGQSAQLGKIGGSAKVILSFADLNKVNDGDILVAAMTTPDYLPALKKAGGFITDEGGITCHAAIVARELKKPCIIGTKIATQVLKDGDFVEVDANKGIVKIIK